MEEKSGSSGPPAQQNDLLKTFSISQNCIITFSYSSGRILSQESQPYAQELSLTLPAQTLSGAYLLTIVVEGKRFPFKLIVQN